MQQIDVGTKKETKILTNYYYENEILTCYCTDKQSNKRPKLGCRNYKLPTLRMSCKFYKLDPFKTILNT